MAEDRALDAEVAEKVLDQRVVWHEGCPYFDDVPPGVARFPVREVPEYSRSIYEAWWIAEDLGLLVTPTLTGGWGAGQFQGTTGHPDGGRRYCVPGTWAEAEDAPEAICRAALLVMAQKPD